jgi:hypothetical protein
MRSGYLTGPAVAASVITGTTSIAQASTVHAMIHVAAGHAGKAIDRPGPCGGCRMI